MEDRRAAARRKLVADLPAGLPVLNSIRRHRERLVLLTGFEPFAGETVNPSWQAVRLLDGTRVGGHRVAVAELPCAFAASLPALRRALRKHDPRVVVATGLAGGREGISLERIAINVIDARIPDNAGAQPIDVPVVRTGPAAYFSTLPLKASLQALQADGIPAHVSQTAGTYVCNQVFYGMMHALRRRPATRAGFVHVPWLPDQARAHRQPGMPLEHIVRALEIIVDAALTTRQDRRIPGGNEH
jgi:pyroglutamyl-peptidase